MLLELADLLTPEEHLWILDRPHDRVSQWLRPFRRLNARNPQGIQYLSERVSVITPMVPIHDQLAYRVAPLEALNLRALQRHLQATLRASATQVMWLMHPSFAHYRHLFPGAPLVYDCYDEYIYRDPEGPAMAPRLLRLEQELMTHSTLNFTASERVAQTKVRDYQIPKPKVVPNPTCARLFAPVRHGQVAIAPDLQAIPEPRIGYVGGIKPWIDANLLWQAARALPQASFVLVGPHEKGFDLQAFAQQPNVYFLGHRPYQELPSYMAGFHVGMIPYDIHNPYMQTINPYKAKEYLVSGREVVAIDIEALHNLAGDYVHLARDVPTFIAHLQTCLARPRRVMPEAELAPFAWPHYLLPILEQLRAQVAHG